MRPWRHGWPSSSIPESLQRDLEVGAYSSAPKPWRREGRIVVAVKFLASRNKFTLKAESIVFISQSGPWDGSFAILSLS